MGQGAAVKTILNELGLVSRTEVSQARNLIKGALQASKRPLTGDELQVLVSTYLKILAIDVRKLGNTPKATLVGLGYILGQTPEGGRLAFVSFASPAYVQNTNGEHIDILAGTSKEEYHKLSRPRNPPHIRGFSRRH